MGLSNVYAEPVAVILRLKYGSKAASKNVVTPAPAYTIVPLVFVHAAFFTISTRVLSDSI